MKHSKGLWMEDIGLIFDLIKKAAAAEDMSGLLNLIDYKKTFVSLEWSFIKQTLIFNCFGLI